MRWVDHPSYISSIMCILNLFSNPKANEMVGQDEGRGSDGEGVRGGPRTGGAEAVGGGRADGGRGGGGEEGLGHGLGLEGIGAKGGRRQGRAGVTATARVPTRRQLRVLHLRTQPSHEAFSGLSDVLPCTWTTQRPDHTAGVLEWCFFPSLFHLRHL